MLEMNGMAGIEALLCAPSRRYPRNSEADVAMLPDGALLLAYTRFDGLGDDEPACIVGRRSADRGRTWTDDEVLQENDAALNCMSASLLVLESGELLLFYLRKNSATDCQVWVKRSSDGGRTWVGATSLHTEPGYYVVANSRASRLSSGRLIVPFSRCEDARGPEGGSGHYRSSCFLSDDEGRSWRLASSWVDLPRRGAMEPAVAELSDGSLVMLVRSQLGRIYCARSTDGGETWAAPELVELVSPEAPCALRRVPGRGDLLLVWNDNYDRGMPHGGLRCPLRAAVSPDGRRWCRFRTLEANPDYDYSYPSITFVNGEVVLTYYARERASGYVGLRMRVLPLQWFYQLEDELLRSAIYA